MTKIDAAIEAIDAAANLASDDVGYIAILESLIEECEARIESMRYASDDPDARGLVN